MGKKQRLEDGERHRLGGADRQTNKHVDLCWLNSCGKQERIRLGWPGWGANRRISRKEWAVLSCGVTQKVGSASLGGWRQRSLVDWRNPAWALECGRQEALLSRLHS